MRKPPFHKSVLNSIRGLGWMLKNERNFQLEVMALIINIILILIYKVDKAEASLILILSATVLCAEILNTAIEKICDIVEPNYDPKIGIIKDIAAGAVVLLAITAIVVGLLVYPKYVFV